MYHYTQFAAMELPETYGYSSKELWLDKVPQIAFESDIMLDSLLTVAALHMQDLMPEDHKLGVAVNHYLDRTLTKHRYSLGRIDRSVAEPLFLTAFMLCITSWQLEHRRSLTADTYRVPSNVFAIVRGCCALQYAFPDSSIFLFRRRPPRAPYLSASVSPRTLASSHTPTRINANVCFFAGQF